MLIEVTTEMNLLTGDGRANENVYLTSLHTLFLREHNRIASILSQLNHEWDDEKIYQQTRKVTAAIIQHIAYNEYLPVTLGPQLIRKYDLQLSRVRTAFHYFCAL